mgnify:CR=1 FL=1
MAKKAKKDDKILDDAARRLEDQHDKQMGTGSRKDKKVKS